MLVLKKRHGSKFWTARGTYCGIKVDRSLRTGDRGEAQLLLAKIQKQIYDEQTGQSGGDSFGPTFAEAVINYVQKGGERRFLEPLLKYFGDLPIKKVDQAAIDQAALSLYPKAGPAARNREVYGPISAILKSNGVTVPVRRLKTPDGVIRWITHEEASRLIDSCAPHLKPLVSFLLYTGARAGEALWLEWRNVDLNRGHVIFEKTKNGSSRGVPLHKDLVAILANLPHREGMVFRQPNGQPYSLPRGDADRSAGSRIKTGFQAAVRRAGLKDFRVHDARHTWATWFYREHRDLLKLQHLGGWKTLTLVTRYAHVNSENFRDSINAMPSLDWATHGQKISAVQKTL